MDYVCLVLFYCLWFIATVWSNIANLADTKDPFKLLHYFALIPNWSFFAPVPSTNDFHVEYRFSIESCWEKENLDSLNFIEERKLRDLIFNPKNPIQKFKFDIIQSLIKEALILKTSESLGAIQINLPYLIILNNVSQVAKMKGYEKVQFGIFRTNGFGSISTELVFTSSFHPV